MPREEIDYLLRQLLELAELSDIVDLAGVDAEGLIEALRDHLVDNEQEIILFLETSV